MNLFGILKAWIDNGAKWKEGSSRISRFDVVPAEVLFKESERHTDLRAEAVFEDGSRQNVTSLCTFAVKDVDLISRRRWARSGCPPNQALVALDASVSSPTHRPMQRRGKRCRTGRRVG